MNTSFIRNKRIVGFIVSGFIFTHTNAQKMAVDLSVMQDGQEIKITGQDNEVVLKKKEFKLLFNSLPYTDKKSYATQIDAFTDAKGIAMIHQGVKIDDIPYFSPGTGMACDSGKEYPCMYIDKNLEQQHYIYYQEKGDKRAALVNKGDDGMLRLSWTIDKYSVDNTEEIPISKIDITGLYVVVLNDFNLNGKVDAGEYTIVHLIFQ